jgi:hypothetical protein
MSTKQNKGLKTADGLTVEQAVTRAFEFTQRLTGQPASYARLAQTYRKQEADFRSVAEKAAASRTGKCRNYTAAHATEQADLQAALAAEAEARAQ